MNLNSWHRSSAAMIGVPMLLCACSSGTSNSRPQAATAAIPQNEGRAVAGVGSARAMQDRAFLNLPASQVRQHILATLPAGTRVFHVDTVDVRDGTNQWILATPVRQNPTSNGYTLTDAYGHRLSVSKNVVVTPDPNGYEVYQRPGVPLPKSLVGKRPVMTITGEA